MKTENTPENKAKFYKLLAATCQPITTGGWRLLDIVSAKTAIEYDMRRAVLYNDANDDFWEANLDMFIPELTPLSEITDEDAKFLSDGEFSAEEFVDYYLDDFRLLLYHLGVSAADYLRSKGYNCGWIDLSPEDLVDYGWVKYKEE